MVKIAAEVRGARFLRDSDHDRIGRITASFGVAKYQPGMSARELIQKADASLYDAKAKGRNRVCAPGIG